MIQSGNKCMQLISVSVCLNLQWGYNAFKSIYFLFVNVWNFNFSTNSPKDFTVVLFGIWKDAMFSISCRASSLHFCVICLYIWQSSLFSISFYFSVFCFSNLAFCRAIFPHSLLSFLSFVDHEKGCFMLF